MAVNMGDKSVYIPVFWPREISQSTRLRSIQSNNGGCSVCECSLVRQNFVTDNLVPRAGSIVRAFYPSRKKDNLYFREPQRYTLTICQHLVLSTRRDVPGKTTHNRVRIRRDFCSYGTRYSGTLLKKARGFVICGEPCA
jgi:hypothetical protein